MKLDAAPGSALLHPFTKLSLGLLLFNDHWLKHTHPGALSGKLSDFAAMFLMPVLLHALFEVGYARLRRRSPSAALSTRALLICILFSGLVFALPEVWKPAEAAYRIVGGVLLWPYWAVRSLWHSQPLPALRLVSATADVTDLFALSSAYLVWRVARREAPRGAVAHARVAKIVVGALFAVTAVAHPTRALAAGSQPYVHDRFYAHFEIGPALMWIHSPASVSNGFQQAIPSTTAGMAWAGNLELGGTLSPGLVLGGAIGYAQLQDPTVSTRGQRFTIPGGDLVLFDLKAFARYYPEPKQGLHFGTSLGIAGVDSSRLGGQDLRGASFSLEAGHGLWLARQWTLGIAVRVTAAGLRGDVPGTTVLLMPGVFATLTCH